MISTVEAVLLFVLVVLAVLLLVLGIQVFFILRELRQTVVKANKVLDDTGSITGSVSAPLSKLSSIALGVKTGASIAALLTRKKKSTKKEEEEEDE